MTRIQRLYSTLEYNFRSSRICQVSLVGFIFFEIDLGPRNFWKSVEKTLTHFEREEERDAAFAGPFLLDNDNYGRFSFN